VALPDRRVLIDGVDLEIGEGLRHAERTAKADGAISARKIGDVIGNRRRVAS
jgi:hypothetical protein